VPYVEVISAFQILLSDLNLLQTQTFRARTITVQREQKKTENTKRRVSAQKGMRTKRPNVLDLEMNNRDTEWSKSTSKIAKQHGYNKMVATKNLNMLEEKK
jgi:hypothetical protein